MGNKFLKDVRLETSCEVAEVNRQILRVDDLHVHGEFWVNLGNLSEWIYENV